MVCYAVYTLVMQSMLGGDLDCMVWYIQCGVSESEVRIGPTLPPTHPPTLPPTEGRGITSLLLGGIISHPTQIKTHSHDWQFL